MKHHSLQRRGSEAAAHSGLGIEAMAVLGSPPPRIVIGDLRHSPQGDDELSGKRHDHCRLALPNSAFGPRSIPLP
jgi:hypothetical protein